MAGAGCDGPRAERRAGGIAAGSTWTGGPRIRRLHFSGMTDLEPLTPKLPRAVPGEGGAYDKPSYVVVAKPRLFALRSAARELFAFREAFAGFAVLSVRVK